MMGSFFPPKPGEVAREAFNPYDADLRRRSISLLSSAKFGGEEAYVRMYRLLIDDHDATVRAACVKALGEHGKVDDAKLIVPRLRDEAAIVRWEAAKALQRIHNPIAAEPLMAALSKDEDADVRMAAAYALGQYAQLQVFDVLVGGLDDSEYGVVEAANTSLKTQTGYDFGTDGAMWLIFRRDHPTDLFKNQEQYVWHPFVKPRTLVEKAQFWKTPPKVEPQPPLGMDSENKGS